MTEKLDASDPYYHQAIAELQADTGINVNDVLLPDQWCVFMVDGRPCVCLNEAGMRAIALVSPRPDAREYVEELLAAIKDMEKG